MAQGRSSTRTGTSAETKRKLVDGARELLSTVGYGGATARAIGAASGCNQALVFYHFGSLHRLLLAALDASSGERLARYREELAQAKGIRQVLQVVRRLQREDRDSGHVTVLAQMVAGGAQDPELGAEVAARVEPWVALTREAVLQTVPTAALRRRLPVDQIADAVVAMSLGLELLSILSGDHRRADAVFDRMAGSRSLLVRLLE